MAKAKFYRRWKRRFRKGLTKIQSLLAECLCTGSSETIHDLRVTLRRIRMLAMIGTPALGKSEAGNFRQWALKVTTTLGRLRDLDVILEWMKAHYPPFAGDPIFLEKRVRAWQLARPHLRVLSRRQWHPMRQSGSSQGRRGKLCKKFCKEYLKIRDGLMQDAARFDMLNADALHSFRRRLRRLRYLRELKLSRFKQAKDARLERLIALQEALGEMHNCVLLHRFFSSHPTLRSRTQIIRLAQAQEIKWRNRAGAYLPSFMREKQG